MSSFLSFHLPNDFLVEYQEKQPKWGFPIGGGNSLSELVFITKYSRLKDDGTKERWWEVCQRCIEGYYSILKDHCFASRTPWNEYKAQRSAIDAYERMFSFKWMPSGRGLWMMGTDFVNGKHNSSSLQSCAFVSTEKLSVHSVVEATLPFVRLMEMSMLGIGVGFDTRGMDKLTFQTQSGETETWTIPDTREGWCDSLQKKLETYFFKNRSPIKFDYSKIRPAGDLIRGFGGVAAGPQPLIDLHDKLDELYQGRGGTLFNSQDITDICNLIAKCVVSGNVRRSALLAIGDASDDVFLDLKNAKVFPERNGVDGWGWSSNNTILAEVNGDYTEVVNRIVDNGEPGLFFIDLARQYGRLADAPDSKDSRIMGCNPCHSYDSMILTDEGMVEIGSAAGKTLNIWNGSNFARATVWKTGVKPVYEVELVNGLKTKVTEDHILAVWINGNETEVPAKAIEGLAVKPLLGPGEWSGYEIEDSEAVLCGLLFGDGWTKPESHAVFMRNREAEVIEFLAEMEYEVREYEQTLFGARKILESHGLDITNNLPYRALPREAFQWSSDTLKKFLRGLFSANGAAQPKYSRISLKTTCKELAEQVQKILVALGYPAYITTNAETDIEWSNGTFTSKESYDVNIGSSFYYNKFQVEIGFLHRHKSIMVPQRVAQLRGTKVRSITPIGIVDVYDFCEPDTHWGWVDGFKSHNCAEQPLESYEQCNLVESFPYAHESIEDFQQTLKHAYLYGKAVTLLPTHWPETNAVMQRNRRIGCSVSGLAQFIEGRSWAELRTWLDQSFQFLRQRDIQYSEWLGIRESIRFTTVKPSGTVSLVAGATPGVHWPVASGAYIRRIRFANTDPMLDIIREAGYKVEPDVVNSKTTSVVEFPTTGPRIRDERDVSVWEKAELAVLCQRWWSNNMVSCTLTFSEDEREQIPALVSAKSGQLKTMSLLPLTALGNHPYPQMPYEEVSDEKIEAMSEPLKAIGWDRIYVSGGLEAEGEKFCTTDVCEISKFGMNNGSDF